MRFISMPQLIVAALALTAACNGSKNKNDFTRHDEPVVQSVKTTPSSDVERVSKAKTPKAQNNAKSLARADEKAKAVGVTEASQAVQAQVTLNKAAITDRTFLYGFDLQYSSGADATYDLINQSIAMGHIPATFRRVGDLLQLIGDQSRLFESDINHPEVLLAEYRVIAENAETISVEFLRSGLAMNRAMHGRDAAAPQLTWIRSLEFVAEGSYLLQESAILLADGSVETYMESLFPRATLVPENYEPILADADREPLAARYRFLSNESVYLPFTYGDVTVREQTKVANRYNIDSATTSGTIDWYVTPNIPEKFMPAVKSGIEGWNRYFEPQVGRKVMRFLGRLPAGVKIGDPRYNVINWDSVAYAGAAYESQASDPTTGIQSHSLIYLPFAWYNIGADLWHRRVDAANSTPLTARAAMEKLAPKGAADVFGKDRKVLRCVRTLDEAGVTAGDLISSLNTDVSTDEFGIRILTSTLFHEVGHALGLDHNFKGSLSYDGSQPVSADNPTTWSIMDYNYYQHELGLFGEIGTTEGHALEYDRQIISQLYNRGADVSGSDLVVPACNDEEADNTSGGADPLCNRYDSDKNPAEGLWHALGNLSKISGAAGYETMTLAEAIRAAKPAVVAKLSDTSVTTPDMLIDRASELGNKVGELTRFYIASGAQSVRGNVMNNEKALRVWGDESGFSDPASARTTYKDAYRDIMSWVSLPTVPADAASDLKLSVRETVIAHAAAGANDTERNTTADAAVAAFSKALDAKVQLSLTMLRQVVIGNLLFDDANPFAVRLASNDETLDFENFAAQSLATQVLIGLESLPAADLPALAAERLAAAKTLASFKGYDDDVISVVVEKLNSLVSLGRRTGNQNLVDQARELLKAL